MIITNVQNFPRVCAQQKNNSVFHRVITVYPKKIENLDMGTPENTASQRGYQFSLLHWYTSYLRKHLLAAV